MSNGRYLCLIICRICRLMVMKKSTRKYISRIGQNTGTSKMEKNVATKPYRNALLDEYL